MLSNACEILKKLESFIQIFEKQSNIKFHENPSSGSRVVLCGRTDMTRLTVTFHNFCERAWKSTADTHIKKAKTYHKIHF